MTKYVNEDFELAFNIVENTGTNLFLTGRAGTGKTTFLRSLVKRSGKQIVVSAPTGIAAINAGGVTLHSLFQLDFGLFLPGMKRKPLKFNRNKLRLIRFMDLLVIDEVSMVRADLLDAVDDVLRRVRNPALPFGGVQLLLIGDLRQLPPVVTEAERRLLEGQYASPYFFSSHALESTRYVTVELGHVYRQEDDRFIDMLASVRDGHPTAEVINALNARYIPGFKPNDSRSWIRLTSHNATAHAVNAERMQAIKAKPYNFKAEITGSFPENAYPCEVLLTLKVGAQVMFIKNDPQPTKKFFNGMIGTVTYIDGQSVRVAPESGGEEISVGRAEWENITYKLNTSTGQIEEKVEGVFSQIPLRAAWAITIHKSQGLTFSHAIVDASSCFAHGQAYVALSRLRSLEGLVLSAPIPPHAIISDPQVNGFMASQSALRPTSDTLADMETQYAISMLNSLYDCSVPLKLMDELSRLVFDAYHGTYPSVVDEYGSVCRAFEDEVASPARVFKAQYTRLLMSPDSRPMLTQRLKASASYFPGKIFGVVKFLGNLPRQIDNGGVAARLREKRDELRDMLWVKSTLILSFEDTPFSTASLQANKRKVMLQIEKSAATNKGHVAREASKAAKETPAEVTNPELFKELVEWRRNLSKEQGLPAFRILPTRTLIQIAASMPSNRREFLAVKGCGERTANLYAEAIIAILNRFR